jgi:hypothetical protein
VITPVANAKLRRQSYVEEKQKKKKGRENSLGHVYADKRMGLFAGPANSLSESYTLTKTGPGEPRSPHSELTSSGFASLSLSRFLNTPLPFF